MASPSISGDNNHSRGTLWFRPGQTVVPLTPSPTMSTRRRNPPRRVRQGAPSSGTPAPPVRHLRVGRNTSSTSLGAARGNDDDGGGDFAPASGSEVESSDDCSDFVTEEVVDSPGSSDSDSEGFCSPPSSDDCRRRGITLRRVRAAKRPRPRPPTRVLPRRTHSRASKTLAAQRTREIIRQEQLPLVEVCEEVPKAVPRASKRPRQQRRTPKARTGPSSDTPTDRETDSSLSSNGGADVLKGLIGFAAASAPAPAPAPETDGARARVLKTPSDIQQLSRECDVFEWKEASDGLGEGLEGIVGEGTKSWMRENVMGPVQRYLECLDAVRASEATGAVWPRQRPVDPCYNDLLQRVLLAGPPGSGKTWAAQCAVADLCKAHGRRIRTLKLSMGTLTAKYVGCAERDIINLFQHMYNPLPGVDAVILFMDEVDAILGQAGPTDKYQVTLLNQVLSVLQDRGVAAREAGRNRVAHVTVIACTNWADRLAGAALSRFSRQRFFPGLSSDMVKRIVQKKWTKMVRIMFDMPKEVLKDLDDVMGEPEYIERVIASHGLSPETLEEVASRLDTSDVRMVEACIKSAQDRHLALEFTPAQYASTWISKSLSTRALLVPLAQYLLEAIDNLKRSKSRMQRDELERSRAQTAKTAAHAASVGFGVQISATPQSALRALQVHTRQPSRVFA